jgi:hypothetical protein
VSRESRRGDAFSPADLKHRAARAATKASYRSVGVKPLPLVAEDLSEKEAFSRGVQRHGGNRERQNAKERARHRSQVHHNVALQGMDGKGEGKI